MVKEKTKKIWGNVFDISTYMTSFGFNTALTYLLYKIYKYGEQIIDEPNIYVLLTEIGLGAFSSTFIIYKFVKSILKRYSKK